LAKIYDVCIYRPEIFAPLMGEESPATGRKKRHYHW